MASHCWTVPNVIDRSMSSRHPSAGHAEHRDDPHGDPAAEGQRSRGFVEQLVVANDTNLDLGDLNITDQILVALDQDDSPENAGVDAVLTTIPNELAFVTSWPMSNHARFAPGTTAVLAPAGPWPKESEAARVTRCAS